MTKKPDRPSDAPTPRRKPRRDAADVHRDFYFDELMTPQPDATREFFRARLLKPARPPRDREEKDGGK